MSTKEVEALLGKLNEGDAESFDKLMELCYGELRAMARRQVMRWNSENSLSATGLVNESYLALRAKEGLAVTNKAHFMALLNQAMRWLLLDRAKAKRTGKRGGRGTPNTAFDEERHGGPGTTADPMLEALDSALTELRKKDPRLSRIIELRYLGGLEIEEVALVLGISKATVKRDWALAKAWLLRTIKR